MTITFKHGLICLLVPVLIACSCAKGNSDKKGGDGNKTAYEGKVETYRYYAGLAPSTKFYVTVNGEQQFVYPTSEQHLCAFGCEGKVTVEIDSPSAKITEAIVRPIAKNPDYVLENGKITLKMSPKDRFVVEINGEWDETLLIFANPIDSLKPDKNDPNVIFFEAGKVHSSGIISPEDGQTVYFEGGALVNGRVLCQNKKHVTFAGAGMLNCTPGTERAFTLDTCDSVLVKDLIVLNTSNYGIVFRETDHVLADNVKTYGEASQLTATGVENDSFDLHGCRYITHKHCFSYCHDDTYCIKTRKWTYDRSTTDIVYEDCIGWNIQGGNTFEIGWECGRDVTNVTYKDIYSVHTSVHSGSVAYMNGGSTIHQADGGVISNISYENVYLEDIFRFGLYFIVRENKGPSVSIGNDAVWSPGAIKNVKMKNVHLAYMPPCGNCAKGLDKDHSVEVEIDGLYIGDKRITSLSDANFSVGPYAKVTLK
ncbi:MAG: hypothetical protein IJ686_04225 [Bacteroidales bacterium]|nr:hypothetical protein [Bacteroidales bacterium]